MHPCARPRRQDFFGTPAHNWNHRDDKKTNSAVVLAHRHHPHADEHCYESENNRHID
jgi:hypothetical protein